MSLAASRNVRTRRAAIARCAFDEAGQEIFAAFSSVGVADVDGLDMYGRPILTFEEVRDRQISRRLKRWMRSREDVMLKVGLARPASDGVLDFFSSSLRRIGVNTPLEGNRFLDLYLKAWNPRCSWVSGLQVNQERVAVIALTPNYNRLPSRVREGLVYAPDCARIGGDRIGNIWRLPDCVKAWKWAPLPKAIAEKIGRCSPKMRMLAAIAWLRRASHDDDWKALPRHVQEASFWRELSRLHKLPLREQIEIASSTPNLKWGRRRWEAFLGVSLGLPWGLVELPKAVSKEDAMNAVIAHGSPKDVCRNLFGASGKATVRAFQSAKKDNWQWASAIAWRNADAVQKILAMRSIIAWEPEATGLLRSLPMSARLRMLQTTTFKYRGETLPLNPDHVRDAGYLWENIREKPDLGRVRCWFSLHETLAAAFVKELPDGPVPVHPQWEPLDGLCDINGAWELQFPRCVATLKVWGQALNNCVGGYGPAIKSGRSVVFVVRERGTITHCVEIEMDGGPRVRQFYGPRNAPANPGVKQAVLGAVNQALGLNLA